MKKIAFIVWIVTVGVWGAAAGSCQHPKTEEDKTACLHMAQMQKLSDATAAALLKQGQYCAQLEPTAAVFKHHPRYQTLCHLRIVQSANYGDFPSYDGYHFKQILDAYPTSKSVDDAAYALIYVITEDTHNYEDPKEEQRKLRTFVKRYPRSRHKTEALKRIQAIDRHPEILD